MPHNIESTQNKKSLIALSLACIFACIALACFSYYYATKDSKESSSALLFDDIEPQAQEVLYLQSAQDIAYKGVQNDLQNSVQESSQELLQVVLQEKFVETKQPPHDTNQSNQRGRNKDSIKRFAKPKVAIIIDDLANRRDIQNFESLDLRLNLSLFPKQFFSKHNPSIAKTLPFYMIHLPLEAHNFEQEGVTILRTSDSAQIIESHIAQIKRDFPNLRYINNHTGSRYTEDREAMARLLVVLEKHNIGFVDSRTTAKSAAKALFKEKNKLYLARDVFLDNEATIHAVSRQLELALRLADKKGYVIAIGHPKEATYKVLQQYKARLLRDYDMVYISELDTFLQTKGIKNTDTALR